VSLSKLTENNLFPWILHFSVCLRAFCCID
jgi:hypothetical protein